MVTDMKKLLVGLVLSLLGAVAHSQWVELATGDNGDRYFVDPQQQKSAQVI